jgi:hypothetical protein
MFIFLTSALNAAESARSARTRGSSLLDALTGVGAFCASTGAAKLAAAHPLSALNCDFAFFMMVSGASGRPG